MPAPPLFHGLFAPNAKLRPKVVPGGKKAARPCPAATPTTSPEAKPERTAPGRDGTSRIDWAALLTRVFKVDVLACARCGGRMKVIAVIEEPPVVEKILCHLGLLHVPLPIAPARGQRAFDFFAA